MRSALVFPAAFVTLIAAAGCASIIGIPEASIEWCQQSANNGHDFCEDFDHADPFGAWASPPPPPGTTRGLAPGESPPFALDTVVGPLEAGASAFTGLETSFSSQTFNDVKVHVDIRIAQTNFEAVDDVVTGAGLLLLADLSMAAAQPSLCVGLGLLPSMTSETVELALFLVPNSSDCVTVNNLPGDAAADAAADAATPSTDDDAEAGSESALPAYPQPHPVGAVYLGTWTHIALEVQRNAADGSGTITFTATPGPGGGGMVPIIPPNSLSAGVPELGIATDVTGPSGAFEVLFDNVTVDFGG